MQKIYLDNAATSWPKPQQVYAAMDNYSRNIGANPGRGMNNMTLAASTLVLETRELLAQLFNIENPLRIAFTYNVTESLNVALKGILRPGEHLIISSMEHNALARPAHSLKARGIDLTIVPCSRDGLLNLQDIKQAIKQNTKMIALLHASNVIGTVLPVAQIGRIARDAGILFMVDAAQSAGLLPIDVNRQSIDVLAFTGHKGLFGPQGTGGIYVREGIAIRPLKEGGTGSRSQDITQPDFMPDSLESGTLNTPGLVGLGAGVRFILENGIAAIQSYEQQLMELLLQGLSEIDGISLYGLPCLQNRTTVVSFNISNLDSNHVSFILDTEFGIISRAGLHCAPLAHQTIGTLEQGTCRLSPGYFTTKQEIEKTIDAIAVIAQRHRK